MAVEVSRLTCESIFKICFPLGFRRFKDSKGRIVCARWRWKINLETECHSLGTTQVPMWRVGYYNSFPFFPNIPCFDPM